MKSIKTIKFTGASAASHWGLDAATLAGRFKASGTKPDKDGLFSVSQINRAAFGDFDGETLRLLTAKADIAQHELAIARGEFVDLEAVRLGWSEIVLVARGRLLALPGAIASRLVGLDWPSIKSKLDDEIQRALCDVANAPIGDQIGEKIQTTNQ